MGIDINDKNELVLEIDLPKTMTIDDARSLARALLREADVAERRIHQEKEAERIKNVPPVDRSKQTLTDGSPVPVDRSHTEDRGDGQQKGYVVLSEDERKKGFVRPVRRTYRHKPCGSVTTMGQALAETYARDPFFYSGTFCCACSKHFPLDQFVWDDDGTQVGS